MCTPTYLQHIYALKPFDATATVTQTTPYSKHQVTKTIHQANITRSPKELMHDGKYKPLSPHLGSPTRACSTCRP